MTKKMLKDVAGDSVVTIEDGAKLLAVSREHPEAFTIRPFSGRQPDGALKGGPDRAGWVGYILDGFTVLWARTDAPAHVEWKRARALRLEQAETKLTRRLERAHRQARAA